MVPSRISTLFSEVKFSSLSIGSESMNISTDRRSSMISDSSPIIPFSLKSQFSVLFLNSSGGEFPHWFVSLYHIFFISPDSQEELISE
jgi:hypothetical protein